MDGLVGTTVVNCSATDGHSNIAQSAFNVNVTQSYNWTGFFQPVNNPPVVNAVKAGSAVPVKFSLGGYQGLDVMAAGSPGSATIPCDSTAAVDDLTETVTARSSTLTCDACTDQYIYLRVEDRQSMGRYVQAVTSKFERGLRTYSQLHAYKVKEKRLDWVGPAIPALPHF